VAKQLDAVCKLGFAGISENNYAEFRPADRVDRVLMIALSAPTEIPICNGDHAVNRCARTHLSLQPMQ